MIIGAKVLFAKQRWLRADGVREDVSAIKREMVQQKVNPPRSRHPPPPRCNQTVRVTAVCSVCLAPHLTPCCAQIEHLEAAAVKKIILGSSAPEARARKAKAHEGRMEQVRLQREQLAATNQAFREQRCDLVERRREQHDVVHQSKFVPEESVLTEVERAGTANVLKEFFRFFKPWLSGPQHVLPDEPDDAGVLQRL